MPTDPPDSLPVLAIAPLERLPIAAGLDGRHGANRARDNRPQIAADTDVAAVTAWLARFADTRTTFDNYRKEAERLLLWSTVQMGKPLSSLTHEDLLVYQRFLADPQPAARWITPQGRRLARSHPDWRPFAGPLAPVSQRQAIVILNALFSCKRSFNDVYPAALPAGMMVSTRKEVDTHGRESHQVESGPSRPWRPMLL